MGYEDTVLGVGKKYGIDEALTISTSKIYVNHWVGLKYRYDGKDACKHILSPDQTYKLLKEFRRAVLVIGSKQEDFSKAVFEMEQELVKEGYFRTIALVNTPCALCNNEEPARPSLESLGVDILTTVRKFKKNVPQPMPGEYPPYAIILVG